MRTTITLSESVLKAAKRRAAERGVTLSTIIEEALRTELSQVESKKPAKFKVITFGGSGLRPGVSLERITAQLDDEEALARFGARRGRR